MNGHGGKRAGAGRPPKEVKKENINFRIDPEDAAEIRKRAAEKGMTVSRFLIDKALDRI